MQCEQGVSMPPSSPHGRHLGAVRHMPLGYEPLVVLLPPSHPLAARSELSWDLLDDQGIVDLGTT